jgi:hypothetical protein
MRNAEKVEARQLKADTDQMERDAKAAIGTPPEDLTSSAPSGTTWQTLT